jgi:transcription elongation factor Elf1
MPQEKPQKPKPKPKKLNLSTKATWKNILKDVEKKECPICVLEKMIVHLKDGTLVTVDIKKLLAEGANPEDVEMHVNQRLEDLDMYIDNVDYFLDVDMLEKTIQPETDKILSKL